MLDVPCLRDIVETPLAVSERSVQRREDRSRAALAVGIAGVAGAGIVAVLDAADDSGSVGLAVDGLVDGAAAVAVADSRDVAGLLCDALVRVALRDRVARHLTGCFDFVAADVAGSCPGVADGCPHDGYDGSADRGQRGVAVVRSGEHGGIERIEVSTEPDSGVDLSDISAAEHSLELAE